MNSVDSGLDWTLPNVSMQSCKKHASIILYEIRAFITGSLYINMYYISACVNRINVRFIGCFTIGFYCRWQLKGNKLPKLCVMSTKTLSVRPKNTWNKNGHVISMWKWTNSNFFSNCTACHFMKCNFAVNILHFL